MAGAPANASNAGADSTNCSDAMVGAGRTVIDAHRSGGSSTLVLQPGNGPHAHSHSLHAERLARKRHWAETVCSDVPSGGDAGTHAAVLQHSCTLPQHTGHFHGQAMPVAGAAPPNGRSCLLAPMTACAELRLTAHCHAHPPPPPAPRPTPYAAAAAAAVAAAAASTATHDVQWRGSSNEASCRRGCL